MKSCPRPTRERRNLQSSFRMADFVPIAVGIRCIGAAPAQPDRPAINTRPETALLTPPAHEQHEDECTSRLSAGFASIRAKVAAPSRPVPPIQWHRLK